MRSPILFGMMVALWGTTASAKSLSEWTSSTASVQAALYDTLEVAARLDARSPSPENSIVRRKTALIIETHEALIKCEARVLGRNRTINYRCIIKGPISTWTNDAGSAQAVLYEAFEAALSEDEKSSEPRHRIRRGDEGLIIRDEESSIHCQAGTKGTAQVQNYACFVGNSF